MGWTTMCGYSKQNVVDHLMRFQDNDQSIWNPVTHCVVGNILWAVVEVTAKVDINFNLVAGQTERFIACYRLESEKGVGWGYKDMEESMSPYHYSCPLSYLEMAPEKRPEWRAMVREWHAEKNDRKNWKHGDQVVYQDSPFERLTLIRPWRKHSQARISGWVVKDKNGINWRLSSRMLTNTKRIGFHHMPPVAVPEPEQVCLL